MTIVKTLDNELLKKLTSSFKLVSFGFKVL